jgi:hypothetical protein
MSDTNADDGRRMLFARDGVSESLHQLLMVWLAGELPAARHIDIAVHKFFDGRLQELMRRVPTGRAQLLLAAPTHQGGWIDPVVFVQRLLELFQNAAEPDQFDLIQAILRLAPDGREQALTAAGNLPGHVGRAVRWVLGSQEGPRHEDSSHTSLWLAAGRSRRPTGALDELPMLKIGRDQPDALMPARYVWKPRETRGTNQRRWNYNFFLIEIALDPAVPSDGFVSTWPTVGLHQTNEHWKGSPIWQYGFLPAWKIDVIAQIWPLCLDPFLVGGIRALVQRVDMPASTLELNHVYLRPWLEPDRPWTELAALAVWIGLISKDVGARTMALDVLIQAVADSRARPRQMSDVLVRMMPGHWVKLNRVADALAEVARLSCAHAWFVAEMLQQFLTDLAELPRNIHFLLSLLSELLTDLGMALAPEARQRLETIQGTSKTAKAAAALRNLASQPDPIKLHQAGLALAEARIARAKRWAGSRRAGRSGWIGKLGLE